MTDLSLPNLPGGLPDKRQVAASFSRAAASYDSVAELQRAVGSELLSRLPGDFSPGRWLDMGCGTGYFSRVLGQAFPESEGLALDIAEGMLNHARPLGGAAHFIAGDAERLPLQAHSCELIFSSLAVQWCADFTSVLSEAHRVLKPGGHFFIRVPAFMWLWSSHDEELQVCYRYRLHDLRKKLEQCGFTIEWTSYATGFLFPVILARRLLKRTGIGGGSDVKPLPKGLGWLDGVFKAILSREALWFKSGRRLLFGLSLICYARKS